MVLVQSCQHNLSGSNQSVNHLCSHRHSFHVYLSPLLLTPDQEAPAGVGFSYSRIKSELTTGDNQTAADNLAALNVFFTQKFPELRNNPFYVSGESYGGVYVPTLSLKIYQSGLLPQMRGFLVGNGVFDWEDAAATHVPFAYGHGFLSTAVHNSIVKTCAGNYVNPTTECKKLLEQIDANMVDVNGFTADDYDFFPSDDGPQQSLVPSYDF